MYCRERHAICFSLSHKYCVIFKKLNFSISLYCYNNFLFCVISDNFWCQVWLTLTFMLRSMCSRVQAMICLFYSGLKNILFPQNQDLETKNLLSMHTEKWWWVHFNWFFKLTVILKRKVSWPLAISPTYMNIHTWQETRQLYYINLHIYSTDRPGTTGSRS